MADDQNKKISILQEEKLELLDKAEQLDEDVDNGHRLVTSFQKENLNIKQEIREWRTKVNKRD